MKSLSEEFEDQTAAYNLRRAKFEALRDALGNYGNFRYVNFYDLLNPNNQNWQDYTYKTPDGLSQGHVARGTPVGEFINNIRNTKNIGEVYKQSELWNSYNGINYIRHFIPRFGMHSTTPSVDSRPVQTIAGGTGGAQGVVTGGSTQDTQTGGTGGIPSTQGVQGAQADAKPGNAVAGGGVQGSNNKPGKKSGMSDAEIDAFLNEELGGDTTGNGTYASAGVPKGGTKTIGFDDPYDPNPGNISLAYVMRNAPEQERRDALINKWNKEHGRESVPYVPGTEIPAGSLNRSSSTYASPSISNGGMYATGEGIKDANGNVLTNPGGDWEYQYALKNPQYGLGMTSKMSDAQRNYLQAVSDDMGYNYNFKGAPRYV